MIDYRVMTTDARSRADPAIARPGRWTNSEVGQEGLLLFAASSQKFALIASRACKGDPAFSNCPNAGSGFDGKALVPKILLTSTTFARLNAFVGGLSIESAMARNAIVCQEKRARVVTRVLEFHSTSVPPNMPASVPQP